MLLAVEGLAVPSVMPFRAEALLPSDVGEQLLAALGAAGTHLETSEFAVDRL